MERRSSSPSLSQCLMHGLRKNPWSLYFLFLTTLKKLSLVNSECRKSIVYVGIELARPLQVARPLAETQEFQLHRDKLVTFSWLFGL